MHFVVIHKDLAHQSSVNSIMRHQVDFLVSTGQRVTVISDRCPRHDWPGVNVVLVDPLPGRGWRKLDFEVCRWSERIRPSKLRAWLGAKEIVRYMRFPAVAAKHLAQMIRTDPVHCIVTHQCMVPPSLRKLRETRDIPLVMVLHGDIFQWSWSSCGIPLTAYLRHTFDRSLRCVTHIISPSVANAQCARDRGVPADRITIISNGVDVGEIGGRFPRAARTVNSPFQLLCISRLSPEKGVDVLLRALALLRDLPIHCRIIGGGSQLQFKQLADKLQLGDCVTFVGYIDRAALGAYYSAAHCLVLPSRSEGHPVAALEALVTGVPVVATAVGGTPETVEHGETGLLVPSDDPAELAAAVRRLFLDENLRLKMSEQALRAAERFAWPDLLSRFRGVLINVASKGAHADEASLSQCAEQ